METSRLILEKAVQNDIEDLVKLDTCPSVREYLGGPIESNSAYQRAKILVKISPDLFWVLRDRNRHFIGTISLKKHHDTDELEISYQLIPDAWGKGFAAEAMKKILEHLHNDRKIKNILAETQTKNLRSINLLNKMGFKEIRELERFGARQTLFGHHA
jgi:ribosomal-protein-alanine N-acetyltransferase